MAGCTGDLPEAGSSAVACCHRGTGYRLVTEVEAGAVRRT